MNWKLPPREKIYEAFSVLADRRYEMTGEGKAVIISSGGDKKYSVTWSETKDALKIYSNDNASKWQGYAGYPIIAILMITGRIAFDNNLMGYFQGIPWNEINKAHKNNYGASVDEILGTLDPELTRKIRSEVESIYVQIGNLNLVR